MRGAFPVAHDIFCEVRRKRGERRLELRQRRFTRRQRLHGRREAQHRIRSGLVCIHRHTVERDVDDTAQHGLQLVLGHVDVSQYEGEHRRHVWLDHPRSFRDAHQPAAARGIGAELGEAVGSHDAVRRGNHRVGLQLGGGGRQRFYHLLHGEGPADHSGRARNDGIGAALQLEGRCHRRAEVFAGLHAVASGAYVRDLVVDHHGLDRGGVLDALLPYGHGRPAEAIPREDSRERGGRPVQRDECDVHHRLHVGLLGSELKAMHSDAKPFRQTPLRGEVLLVLTRGAKLKCRPRAAPVHGAVGADRRRAGGAYAERCWA
mmetsp:Transcript_46406/g.115087  ORF Transcript_46406/g.115087 Transcript_46406/m.115087 type:complete len:318 (+) Transcript_46406:764-1717(+)